MINWIHPTQQILNDGIKIATEYMKESCESEDALALEKMEGSRS